MAVLLSIFSISSSQCGGCPGCRSDDISQELFDCTASREDGYLPPPPATFTPKELYTFNPYLPKVNIITGEYCEEECDLIVGGIEPLSYRRFYGHQGYKDEGYGHWRINPECLFLFNFTVRDHPKYGAIGSKNGSFFLYEQANGNVYSFDAQKNRSFTNGAENTGHNHLLNTRITYRSVKKSKNDYHFYWEGTIEHGNGNLSVFKSDWKQWESGSFSPPYQAKIIEERRPNGNIIRYGYENYNGPDSSRPKHAPDYYVLNSISAYSAKGVLLGCLQVNYQRTDSKKRGKRVQTICVTGSDGRQTYLHHNIREVQAEKTIRKLGKTTKRPAIYDTVLHQVDTTWKPTQYYAYRWEHAKSYFNAPFMCLAGQIDGRVLETHYDLGSQRVVAQSAPVGPNDQMAPIARYEYQSDHTVVYDGENNKTIYRFNGDRRITAVEKYQGSQLYNVEKSEWDPSTGNLLKKTIEDGLGNPFYLAEYTYDKNQNVIEERIGGGHDVTTRIFSKDGFNLKLSESDRPGVVVKYSYIPNTNLLASELVYDHGTLCKRTFHFYDDQIGSARVKTVIDDGKNEDPNNISGVSYRRIIEIIPKRTMPCLGMPEQILEKTIDDHGHEIFLKKVVYAYHPSGKITREDHYDADDKYRYSITNTYDAKERLVGTTDALGNTTAFKYDNNFNLIAQIGPRSDMRKEWVYDRANRPIEAKEWQTDGTVLTTKKQYDKASRVIATVDACGFETKYEHDSLGRVTGIFHPDGTVERKVYDVLGNVIQEIDPNGFVTRKEYNFRGQQTALYRPDGSEEHFSYNDHSDTLASHIDSQGTQTLYFYDIFDHPIRVEIYSRNGELLKVTTATYSPFNKLSETDGEGHTAHYKYDFAGRKIAENRHEKELRYFYDARGNLSLTQEGDAFYDETFDCKGKLIEKKATDLASTLLEQEKYTYDEAGNCTHIVNSKGASETVYNTQGLPLLKRDALGNSTQYSYAYKNGLTITEIDPLGIQTIHFHDGRGNEIRTCKRNAKGDEIQKVERIFDGNKNPVQETHFVFENATLSKTIVHTRVYGPCNRLEKIIEAGQKETLYLYNTTGKLTHIIKPDKRELISEYDAFSRLCHFFSLDFGYTYTYDKNDRVISVFDAIQHAQTVRKYDALSNVIEEKLGNGLTLFSAYDSHGRRTQITFPDSSHAHFSYQANRLFQVSRNGLKYTYAERDLEGDPSKIELPAYLGSITIARDPLSRWRELASPFYSAIFGNEAYDPVGNLCCYQYSDDIGTKKCSYAYDDLNQLIYEDGHSYRHDSIHNRLAKDDLSYTVNDLCDARRRCSLRI